MTRTRIAIVGCGSVSTQYIPNLQRSPLVEIVGVCDSLEVRAQQHAQRYGIAHAFTDLDQMLATLDFELLVNLTPMPFHGPFNRKGLEAGRHVWCEKPISTSLEEAQELLALAKRRNLGLWCAPNSPTSPTFRAMAQVLASGEIGQVFVAHGIYGWIGPQWPGTAWYYRKGGGALFDLGVYNVTTITALLGPARSVVAMSGTAIPERIIEGEPAPIKAEAEDNVALILDHGNTVYSVIQTGFVYGVQRNDWTIQVIGTQGAMTMQGHDWEPKGAAVSVKGQPGWQLRNEDQGDYSWQSGATYIAECLAKGEQPILSGELAVHVLEVMKGALQSAESGQRIAIHSTFAWPLVK